MNKSKCKKEQLIIKTFGSVRFEFNHFFDKFRKNMYIKVFDMRKKLKK